MMQQHADLSNQPRQIDHETSGTENMETIDLRGYQCPLPVLKTRNRMRKLSDGERVAVLTDDPLAAIDIPNFCNEYDQKLIEHEQLDGAENRFILERNGPL